MAEVAALGLRVDGVSNIDQAEKSLSGFSRSAASADKSSNQLTKTSSGLKSSYDRLNSSLSSAAKSMLALGAAAVSLASVSRTLTGFEDSMAQVAAITRATTGELHAMREMAKSLGATTKFSASEAADGIRFLGMAGFSASESLASIPAVLNLATASAMGLADAADIATNIMSGFGIQAQNAAKVADVLAAASSRSNTTVQQLGSAMSTVAPISAALGISLEDTAAAIGTLSDAGIQGERAGTAMRGALASLAGPTTQAQKTLKELGLTVQDVNPQTNDLATVFGRLNEAGLNTAQAMTIFGREAASGALVLTQAAGRVGEFGDILRNAGGEAQRMADIMADSLAGDFKNLESAVESIIIAMGEAGLTAIMRGTIQLVTELVLAGTRLLENLGKVTNFIGSSLSPAFSAMGHVLTTVARNADAILIAISAMYAPAVLGGIATLTRAIGVGLVGAVNALTVAMAANPIGFLIRALATAATAIYVFRDDVKRVFGADLPRIFREMALGAAGALDSMVAVYTGYIAALWETFKTLGANIVIAFENAFDKAREAFSDFMLVIIGGIREVFPSFQADFTPYVGGQQAYLDISEAAKEAFNSSQKFLGSQEALARFFYSSEWESIGEAFDDISGALGELSGGGGGGGGDGGGLPAATDALRKWLAESQNATAAAHLMTAAYLQGGEAIASATRQIQIEQQVLEHGASSRNAVTAAINAQTAALDRQDIAKQINDLREQNKAAQDYLAVLAAQSRGHQQGRQSLAAFNREQAQAAILAGKTAEEVADLVDQYDKLFAESQAIQDATEAMAELNRLVESTRTDQEKYNIELQRLVALRPYAQTAEQAEALERAISNIQRENSVWITFTEDALERINESFANMWKDAFNGSRNAFEGMKRGFRQMLAEMAHAAITQPIMISVGNALMGTNNPGGIGGGGGIFGALNTARSGMTAGSSLGNAAQWLGQKVGSEALTSFGLGLSGTTAATGIASIGASLGASLGTSIGTSAATMASTSFAASMTGGAIIPGLGVGAAGGGVGAGIGAAAGSAAAGAAAGGAAGIGAAVGAALPWIGGALAIGSAFGLFGDDEPRTRHAQMSHADLQADGRFAVTTWDDRQSREAQEAAAAYATEAVKGATELFSKIGIDAEFKRFTTLMESSILGDKQGVGSSATIRIGDLEREIGLAIESSWTKHGFGGWSDAEMLPRLQTDIQLTLLEAFQVAGDALPKVLFEMLDGVDIRGLTAEQAQALAQQFSVVVEQVSTLQEAINNLPFANLRDLSFDAAANLIQFAGGLESLNAGMTSYFQNFYSEEEKLEWATKQIGDAFGELGLTMPDVTQGAELAKAAYRDLVESLDVTTEEGQRAYATLMTLSGGFAELVTGMDQLAEESRRAAEDLRRAAEQARQAAWDEAVADGESAYSALSRAVAAEKTRLQRESEAIATALRNSISAASTTVNELTSLTGRLSSTVQRMIGQTLDEGRNRQWAQERISRALSVATLTSVMPQGADFEQALQTVTQPSQGLFDSFEDYQADFLKTAHTVSELNDLAEGQLSTERRALKALEDQLSNNQQWYQDEMERLDAMLEMERQRLEIAMGTYEAVLTIPEALAGIRDAIANIQLVTPPALGGGGGSGYDPYVDYLTGNPDLMASYLAAGGGNYMDPAQWAQQHWDTYGKYEDRDIGLRSFAVGTNYLPRDMIAQLHEGERVVPQADNRMMIGLMARGVSAGNEFKQLQQELREAQRVNKALLEDIERNTRDTARTNEQMTQEPQLVHVGNVVPTIAAVPGQ